MMFDHHLIWVRGAGELGSAVALTFHKVGLPVFLSELPLPLAIRRPVTFSDAMLTDTSEVEGMQANLTDLDDVRDTIMTDRIPIVVDSLEIESQLHPSLIVDARMQKHNPGLARDNVIGLGPGFIAGQNCLAVIETMRGHNLGRIIWDGPALPNTGIPGNVGGETRRRVIHAPAAGTLEWRVDFGDLVGEGDVIGWLNGDQAIQSPLTGMIRGLISPAAAIRAGLKIADIDPRGKKVDFLQVSDKSRAVARGALEAILIYLNKQTEKNGQQHSRSPRQL